MKTETHQIHFIQTPLLRPLADVQTRLADPNPMLREEQIFGLSYDFLYTESEMRLDPISRAWIYQPGQQVDVDFPMIHTKADLSYRFGQSMLALLANVDLRDLICKTLDIENSAPFDCDYSVIITRSGVLVLPTALNFYSFTHLSDAKLCFAFVNPDLSAHATVDVKKHFLDIARMVYESSDEDENKSIDFIV